MVDNYIDFILGTANAYRVRRGEERTLSVTAMVNNWPGMSSGSFHQLYLHPDPFSSGTPSVTARGVSSSVDLSGPSQEIVGNPVVVRRSYPVVQRLDLSDKVLSRGTTLQKTIAKWSIESVGGETRHKQWTFRISWTDVTPSTELEINNISLVRNSNLVQPLQYTLYDGLGTEPENILGRNGEGVLKSSLYGGHISSSIKMLLIFGDSSSDDLAGEELIPEGMNTYRLMADITNAHQGAFTDNDGITVILLGDDDEIHPTTGVLAQHGDGVAGIRMGFGLERNFNFIWSDYSTDTGDHSSSLLSNGGSDWTNGYLVPSTDNHHAFIPLDSWSLSK
jgi:hypothetical protein